MDKLNIKGGEFLVKETDCKDIFIPEEFDEEQQVLAKDTKNPMSKDYQHDSTDTVEPTNQSLVSSASPTVPDDSQSHSEEPSDAEVELALLEASYAKAKTANEKRSLKMKINKLKKNAKDS